MSFSRLFSEFFHDPRFAMEERRFNAAYSMVKANKDSGLTLEFEGKVLGCIYPIAYNESNEVNASQLIECECAADIRSAIDGEEMSDSHAFINSICIHGVMSRCGDACTYGSREHKDMMMEAADDPRCRGHIILIINSGGGAVGTLLDYREAINYCLERGQNVVAVIDECAASAACFTANMTNRVFVNRDTDEVGSLGMFAIFTTIADGAVIPDTNEVMHIRYAKQSVDKNYAFREAADGNMKPIDKMLEDDLAEILANTMQDRPTLTDDQLTGKMYKARDVMGSMVDEVGGIDEAIDWLMNDWSARNGAPISIKNTADQIIASSDDDPSSSCPKKKQCDDDDPSTSCPKKKQCDDDDPSSSCPKKKKCEDDQDEDDDPNCPDHNSPCDPEEDDPSSTQNTVSGSPSSTSSSNNPQYIMYEHIASALNLESIEHTEEGVMLNAPLAEALDALLASHASALAAKDQAMSDAIAVKEQEISELRAAVENESAEHSKVVNQLYEEHQQAIAQLTADHTAAIESLNAEHAASIEAINAEHQQAIETANAAVSEANANLTTANQRITDLSAEVESLNNAQGQQPQAGNQPANNGRSDTVSTIATSTPYNPALSAREYAEFRKKAMKN